MPILERGFPQSGHVAQIAAWIRGGGASSLGMLGGELTVIEAPLHLRRTVSDRAVDGRVIDDDAALSHHFLLIAEAQTSGRVPANTKPIPQ